MSVGVEKPDGEAEGYAERPREPRKQPIFALGVREHQGIPESSRRDDAKQEARRASGKSEQNNQDQGRADDYQDGM